MYLIRILFATSLIALLASCSGGERRVDQGNRDGVLHFGNGAEPQAVDPHITTGVPEDRIEIALFEGLVGKDPVTLDPVPGVAERWDVSADGRVYHFYLRRDARWSNGDPLTAEDFRWSWWRALQPALGNEYAYMLYPIKNAEAYFTGKLTDFSTVGVRVVAPYTLEVELVDPTPYFLQLVSHHSFYPVPRSVIEKFGASTDRFTQWTRPGNIVTNGPFLLTEWKLNKYVRVEKNPYYWDTQRVRLKAIQFYPTENIITEERMYRSRQLHRTEDVPTDKAAEYKRLRPSEIRLDRYLGSYYYMVNTTLPGLNDARVRRALAMAIDRKTLIDTVLNGVNFPAYAVTPPGTLGYQPPKLFDFDPKGARKLLADAGYPDGKGLPKIEILYNTHESHRKIAVAVQQMWKIYLNIDVSMVNQEWKVYLDTRNRLDFSVCRAAWIGDYVDPNTFLDLWVTGGGNNNTGWSNAEYDDLILRKIPAMKTQAERLAGFARAETILMENMPIVPIYIYSTKHLIQPSVRGMPINLMDFYSFKQVYLER